MRYWNDYDEEDVTDDMFPVISSVIQLCDLKYKNEPLWEGYFIRASNDFDPSNGLYLIFHRGSEAYLDDYQTLDMLNTIYRKSMKNPFGKLITFGMTTR